MFLFYSFSNRYLVFLTLDFFALHLQEVSIEIRNVVSGLELGLIVSNQSLACIGTMRDCTFVTVRFFFPNFACIKSEFRTNVNKKIHSFFWQEFAKNILLF